MDANRHLLSIILLLVALALTGCVVINMPNDEGADISTTTDPSGTEGDSTDGDDETTDTTVEGDSTAPLDLASAETDSTDTTDETTDTGEPGYMCCDCASPPSCAMWSPDEESCNATGGVWCVLDENALPFDCYAQCG
jgi:hypothetical protein